MVESQRLLSDLCQELRQSPRGGMALLKELNRGYPAVPKVFYSRKATIGDVRETMMETGLDVLTKPHPSIENREAASLMEDFARCCAGQPSSWITRWMEKLPPGLSGFMADFLAALATRQARGWRIRSEVWNVCGTSALEEWLCDLCSKAAGRVPDLVFDRGPNLKSAYMPECSTYAPAVQACP